jgi:hypothetical protein
MTPPGSDVDPNQQVRESRPVVQAIVHGGAMALLGTAVLEMIAAAIQGLTEPAGPIFAGGQTGSLPLKLPQISISVSDRLSIFARSGANVTVALVVLVAVLAVATSGYHDQATERSGRLARALIVVSGILASIVIVADAGMCIEVLRNATSVFGGVPRTNRAASFFQFLAPVALSAGALWTGSRRHFAMRLDNARV